MHPENELLDPLRRAPVPVRELIAGGLAGSIAKSSIAPLERCKILFQTGKLRGARLGPTLTHIYRTEGIPGLFRGNGASVLRIVPYAAVHYWAYEHYRRVLVGAGLLGAQEHYVPPVLDLLAGSAAGASAVVVTYPLDLVRTRLAFMTEAGGRMSSSSSSVSSSSAAAAMATTSSGAASGSGSGSGAAAGSSSGGRLAGARLPLHSGRYAGGGLLLASSRCCSSGTCSAGGGSRTSSLAAAAAAARTHAHVPPHSGSTSGGRLQGRGPARLLHVPPLHLPHLSPKHTIRGVLSSTLRKEGIRGLYHGVGASMYGILPYAGLKFYCYQHLKQWYRHTYPGRMTRTGVDGKPRLPVPVMLSFGAVAGLVAQSLTYPFDVVRRQMQVEGLKLAEAAANSPTRQLAGGVPQLSLRSTPQALVLLARQHGWRCLFAGLSINYMKVVPSTAIGFTIYDCMKSALALPTNL